MSSARSIPLRSNPRYDSRAMNKSTRRTFTALIRNAAVPPLCAALPHGAFATGPGPLTDPQVDPAPCVAAAATHDADNIVAICGALVDNEKTLKADRVKALNARAEAYDAKEMIDRAIGDSDPGLRLAPTLSKLSKIR